MSVYRYVEMVGTSETSWEAAAQAAVASAAATVDRIAWVEVIEQRGRVDDGRIVEFQTTLKVGYKAET